LQSAILPALHSLVFANRSRLEGIQVETGRPKTRPVAGWRHAMLQEFGYFSVQDTKFVRPKSSKPEGLEIALKALHGKEHLGLGPHTRGTNRNRQIDLRPLVDVHRQFQ
jgi:hypothetical protein